MAVGAIRFGGGFYRNGDVDVGRLLWVHQGMKLESHRRRNAPAHPYLELEEENCSAQTASMKKGRSGNGQPPFMAKVSPPTELRAS